MNDTVRVLIELGRSASELDQVRQLQCCIESFNSLNEEYGFIETGEREDICLELEAIVHACRLDPEENLVDQWRDR